MSKATVLFAFAAGLLGGVASRYLSPQPVHAENSSKEVRAQSFVLVNGRGTVIGTFSEEAGRPVLRLFDGSRHEIWSAGGRTSIRAAALGK